MHIPPIIRRFSANPHGRDFVAGDIHGCFQLLASHLKRLNFDPAKDRLFTVGDLIDRGPQSLEVDKWLQQDWFHSCLGNHEECLLNYQTDSANGLRWFERYGGAWWLELNDTQRARIRATLVKLPILIEIDSPHGRIGLLHAEVPNGLNWPDFVKQLDAGDSASYQAALWGRKRIGRFFSSKVKGIDRIVCGHSVPTEKKPLRKGNIWFIETGAYQADKGGSLSVLNIAELF